ncbi:hypothetical protein A4D02_09425 [Niastella koreensis]|uniref:CBM-cenC domain-containing protein n=1 Tax=Niastella koreensis TaxID=354356 RepID=A0ABX3NR47_9BACT|nr:hypothetical protein [Niastella koreensis]OQP43694.1 hypothetical protein A4D02_09425 [Niastella koreensis]
MNKNVVYGLFALLFTHLTAKAQKNLVTNGSFEDELYGWTEYGAKTTPYVVKTGKASAVITSLDTGKWTGMHQLITLPKNTQYILISAWMKADNVVKSSRAWTGGLFNIEFQDKNETTINGPETLITVTGDEQWTFTEKAMAVPPGVSRLKLLFALGYATGALFIDDVSVKTISMEEYQKHAVAFNRQTGSRF